MKRLRDGRTCGHLQINLVKPVLLTYFVIRNLGTNSYSPRLNGALVTL